MLSNRLEELRKARIAVMENVKRIKRGEIAISPGMCWVDERLLLEMMAAAREVIE